MPPVGVTVTTSPPASAGAGPSGDIRTYFAAGQSLRGDTTAPIVISSWAQAQDLLGGRVSYGALWDDLQTYFAELGDATGRAVVARVVGPAAVKSTLTLSDASSVATVRLDAHDEGVWGNNITAQVLAGSQTGTFTVVISYNGTEVERYRDLTDPATAVSQINAVSGYVKATNLGSGTSAPGNNPAVLAVTSLAAGANDSGSVTSTSLVTALARFTSEYGPGIVGIPGQPYSAVAAGLMAHAKAYGRVAVTAPAIGTTVSAAGSAARSLRATTGSERLAFVYPWVQIPDGAGGTRTISPEGFTAGRRGATIDAAGAASASKAPAGVAGIARFVTGLERALTTDEINTLDQDAVSSIRLYAGVPRLYGWRSLSLDEVNYKFLTTADLLDDISFRALGILEQYVYRSIDGNGHLFLQIENDLTGLLAPIADADGLYARPNGNPPDPGFLVDLGPTVNTPASINRGEIRAVVEVRDSPVAALIRMTLVKVPTTSDL